VAEDHIKLKDGSTIPTYTLIWTAGVKGTSDAADFGLETARGFRLVANEYMEAKGYEDKNIYIIGDLVFYEEFPNTPTPQIVQAAEQTGHTAASNIVAAIKGGEKHKFKGNYQGFMVSIGAKWGVANLFNKIHLSGFLAIIMKHIVNLKYFFDIRSGYYMFQYLMHEIFHIKDDRTVARGHTSRYGNVLWSVPLRIFYGLVWFVEAFKVQMVKSLSQELGLAKVLGSKETAYSLGLGNIKLLLMQQAARVKQLTLPVRQAVQAMLPAQ